MNWHRVIKRALISALFAAPLAAAVTVPPAEITDPACLQRPTATEHQVRQVIDGDTLVLDDGRYIRLVGINAPELGKDHQPDQPLAREARAYLRDLTRHRRLRVRLAVESVDRYGRTLAHVGLEDGRSIQVLLLRQGLAFAVAIAPNSCEITRYHASEQLARRQKRGVWKHPAYAPKQVTDLSLADTGFQRILGRIGKVKQGAGAVRLEFNDQFYISVPNQYWPLYPLDTNVAGKTISARGWLAKDKHNRLRLRISHPYMLELRQKKPN